MHDAYKTTSSASTNQDNQLISDMIYAQYLLVEEMEIE